MAEGPQHGPIGQAAAYPIGCRERRRSRPEEVPRRAVPSRAGRAAGTAGASSRGQEALVEPVVGAGDQGLDALRHLRAELRTSTAALEQALAAPTPGRHAAWAERVEVALIELSADFEEHVTVTEEPGGTHDAVVAVAPRLANSVRRLVSEHAVIKGLVADLLVRAGPPVAPGEVAAIRDLGTALLGKLARHRQHGADLIYEAYQVDLGGET
jgi:hypothetical protein